MYEIANGLSPDFMIDLMTDLGNQRSTRSNCNVTIDKKENVTCSNKSHFRLPRVKTIYFGLNLCKDYIQGVVYLNSRGSKSRYIKSSSVDFFNDFYLLYFLPTRKYFYLLNSDAGLEIRIFQLSGHF